MDGHGWSDHVGGGVHTVRNRNSKHHRDLNRRFDQVGFGNSNGDCGPDDHFGFSCLLPDIDPNHSDIRLHCNCAGNRELQFRGHMVCQPH